MTITQAHQFWSAGDPDCPLELKASNGELRKLRCKVCGETNPREQICGGVPEQRTGEQLIEEIAKAIHENQWCERWQDIAEVEREVCRQQARAIIPIVQQAERADVVAINRRARRTHAGEPAMTTTQADQELLNALAVNIKANGPRWEREGIVVAYREAAEARARLEGAKAMQTKAVEVAAWAHMVPPDGGSPSEEECEVARAAATAIAALDPAREQESGSG